MEEEKALSKILNLSKTFDTVERSNSLKKERVKIQKYFKPNETLKNTPHLSKELSLLPTPVKSDQAIDILEIKGKCRGNYIYVCQSIFLEIMTIWISTGKNYEKKNPFWNSSK